MSFGEVLGLPLHNTRTEAGALLLEERNTRTEAGALLLEERIENDSDRKFSKSKFFQIIFFGFTVWSPYLQSTFGRL